MNQLFLLIFALVFYIIHYMELLIGKSSEYRICPAESRITTLENHFSMCRHLYNRNLAERIGAYKDDGATISYNQQQNNLPALKEERPWYKSVRSQVLQDVLRRLDNGYQAFLQRIVNSGGRVEREYGLGRGRTDLLVIWRHNAGVQKVVIELKVRRNKALDTIISEGIRQTYEYMDKCGTREGHLIIFDTDDKKTWDEKTYQKDESCQGADIRVWGM